MTQRQPTAAEAMYPNLPGRSDYVAKWFREGLDHKETTAEAFYGRGGFFNPQLTMHRPPKPPPSPENQRLAANLREARINMEKLGQLRKR